MVQSNNCGDRGEGRTYFPSIMDVVSSYYSKCGPNYSLPLDHEVVHILRCFLSLDSRTIITRDHEEDDGVEVYLGMKEYPFLPALVPITLYPLTTSFSL